MAFSMIRIDKDLCYGSGECANSAPEVFMLGDDGTATLRDGGASQQLSEGFLQAIAENCPSAAITIVDAPEE